MSLATGEIEIKTALWFYLTSAIIFAQTIIVQRNNNNANKDEQEGDPRTQLMGM